MSDIPVKRPVFAFAANTDWEDVGEGVSRQILSHDEDMMVVRVEFSQGAEGPPHSHFHRQVTYVESGRFRVTIDGEVAELVKGDTFIVPAHVVHGAFAVEPGCLIDVFTPRRSDFLKG